MSTAKGYFLSIPSELAEHILKFCHARDVARFAETCHDMRELIYNGRDQYLWRELYLLHPFDDPRKSISLSQTPQVQSDEFDWKGELQRRVQAERVMQLTDFADVECEDTELIIRALTEVASAVDSALPVSESYGVRLESHNITWAEKVLFDYPLINDPSLYSTNPVLNQLRARLRCYLALSHEDGETEESDKRLQDVRGASRCFVYDLRKYARETHWGPYMMSWKGKGGEGKVVVNWEHLEHIMNVVIMNVREISNHWEDVWPRWGLESTRAHSAPQVSNRKPHDWAGVEGLWRRVVCFMDYRDLFAFNFSSVNGGPLNPAYFTSEPRFAEAVRLMELELKVKDFDPESQEDNDSQYPPIHFEGVCRGAHSSSGMVEGSVYMFAPGVIRWNFVTAYDGSVNSWSAEGVQIGNVDGALGMAGIWSVALHEEAGDPAGPFWMWKADDPLPHDMFAIPVY